MGMSHPTILLLAFVSVVLFFLFVSQTAYFSCSNVNVSYSSESDRSVMRRELLAELEKQVSLTLRNETLKANVSSEIMFLEEDIPPKPLLILVTPTHNRAAQQLHMQKVVNVLRLLPPPILWVVVEAAEKTEETAEILNRSAGRCLVTGIATKCTTVNYVHIASGHPPDNPRFTRGVGQRNTALEYIESKRIKGIVYFMDDDNVYTPMLFEEFRKIQRKVGVLPVGLLWAKEYVATVPWRQASPAVERALVEPDETGAPKVYGWETFEWSLKAEPGKGRKYQLDMAGFAFNSELLWTPTDNVTGKPEHPLRFISKPAWIETLFLDKLVTGVHELEPLADNCQDVYIWHVKFESAPNEPYPKDWRLPQPQNLVPDSDPIRGISRYVLANGERQKIKDYNESIPFGYKVIPKKEAPKQSWKPKPKSNGNKTG